MSRFGAVLERDRSVQRKLTYSALKRAASAAAICCALLAMPVSAQDVLEDGLRGAITPGATQPAGSQNTDTTADGADPALSDSAPDFGSEVIPEESEDTNSAVLRRQAEEAEALRRRRKSESVSAGPEANLSGFGSTANDRTASQRAQNQRKKGANVNQLTDKKEKSTRSESVRGVKPLEKTPNTAVNVKGEIPAPPGLTVTQKEDGTNSTGSTKGKKQKGKRKAGDKVAEPYDPVGIASGGLTLFPSASTAIGYDTNPRRSGTAGGGSVFNRTALGLRLEGDFGDVRLNGNATGSFDYFIDEPTANRPSANGVFTIERDIGVDTTIEGGLRAALTTESTTSVNLPATTTEEAWRASAGATLGVTQRFGRSSVRLRGLIDREQYFDATLASGATASQEDRNATQFGVSLRGAYETSPGFQPFVEVSADRRLFDDRIDRAGFRRNSTGGEARAGFAFDIDTVVKGEISAGYGLRYYDDSRLDTFGGFVLGGTLTFAATPLTSFTLGAETTIDDTTLTSSSGAFSRTVSLGIEHDLLRNLQLSAALALAQRSPDVGGEDYTLRANLGLEYKIMPELVATGSYAYERQWAAQSINDYDAHVLLFGVKLQR